MLPPGAVRSAGDVDAGRTFPHHGSDPAGVGHPNRRSGRPSEIALTAAEAALVKAVGARHPYPRWLATVGWAGLAAAVALLLGGGPMIWFTAFVVTALIDRIGRLLSRWGVPSFFLQMVGGFVATFSTLGLLAAGALPPSTDPSLVVAASITVLLSGLSLMGAVQDAISGHPVTAAGRAVEIALSPLDC